MYFLTIKIGCYLSECRLKIVCTTCNLSLPKNIFHAKAQSQITKNGEQIQWRANKSIWFLSKREILTKSSDQCRRILQTKHQELDPP